MKALVTGATGFLGSRLTELLLARNIAVTALVRPTSDLSRLSSLSVRLVQGSLDDDVALREAVAGQDVVFHCAALCSDWGKWSEFYSANVIGVAKLADAAKTVGGLRRFVHVSTTDVYGFPEVPADEAAPPLQEGPPYALSKAMGELELRRRAAAGLPTTILRPATIYGPRCPIWVGELASMIRAGETLLIGRGQTPAGLIYVDDVVEAMLRVVDEPRTLGRAYNLVNAEVVTWREYVSGLAAALGVPAPTGSYPVKLALALGRLAELAYSAARTRTRPPLTRHAVLLCSTSQQFPIARAQLDFGFAPAIDFQEGMRRVASWLQRDGSQADSWPLRPVDFGAPAQREPS